jgi:hypothetical protein
MALEVLRRIVCVGVEPAPHPEAPDATHLFTIGFEGDDRDGPIVLATCTNDPAAGVAGVRAVLIALIENPSKLRDAFGLSRDVYVAREED